MAVSNEGVFYTVVAGADISGQQYKNVNLGGVLATSQTNFYGVLQNKPQNGEHGTVLVAGRTKIYQPTSLGPNTMIRQSDATSGVIALAGSGYHAIGVLIIAPGSGSIGTAEIWHGPRYIAK
jgi:hypothetical protein